MKFFLTAIFFIVTLLASAQEGEKPLSGNPALIYRDLKKDAVIKTDVRNANKLQNITLPFKEDFFYGAYQKFPDQSLWSDSSVYVNTGYPIAPMSIGVATFDGLNKRGYPYTPNLFNMSQSLPADTLTSKPINAFTVNSATLQLSDSVALSFYYQARGRGDAPEQNDSLILDFYRPSQGTWQSRVWFAKGNTSPNTSDTIFKRGFVRLDTSHLKDGFMFRFRNKATTAGNFDHWHLDYIYLDKNRNAKTDTSYDDMSFGYVPSPFLARYYEMPWQQYDTLEKASKNTVFIRNNNSNDQTGINMSYEYKIFDPLSIQTHSYSGGANSTLFPFKPAGWSNFTNHSNPPFTKAFPLLSDSADFLIKHRIYRLGPGTDFFGENDSTVQYQRFRNYYAYDDGTAEGGYYVLGAGGQMGIKIKVNKTDTLRAVRIYFDPVGSISAAESYNFRLKVWSSTLTGPGFPMYTDSMMHPKYYNVNGSFKASPEYTLTSPLLLGPGEYFIGIQQFVASGITIGFDKNNDKRNYLYFDSGNGWTQSGVYGALMLRPVFGAKIEPPVGITENKTEQTLFNCFPNPAHEEFTLRIRENLQGNYRLMNVAGQTLYSGIISGSVTISTHDLPDGIYFLTVQTESGSAQSKKIIVQH